MTRRESLEERSYRVRSEMCRGCEHLGERIQVNIWGRCGTRKLKEPTKTMKKFCRAYELHLDYIDRIVGRGYAEDGQDKECDRFRN